MPLPQALKPQLPSNKPKPPKHTTKGLGEIRGLFHMENTQMLIITDPSDVDDPRLQRIVRQRFDQLAEYDCPISDLACFHVVRPDDDVTDLLTNAIDGSNGPSWEWVEDHGGWFEAPIIMSDDGFGHVYFIPDRDDTNAELLSHCRRDALKQTRPLSE